ncbi:hypothetical protein [Nonomuraea sp. SYSU D8015]|uniref:hypothetical protein n=1 Tax=Nonomuraea sp. SYSU D8015 TaxID=2593644 RepID=UPI00166159D9|nr:hypothetical protein [Nonomuraea sp. SYSU D8015]
MPTPHPAVGLRGRGLYELVIHELGRNDSLPADQQFWDQRDYRFLRRTGGLYFEDLAAWDPSKGRNGTLMDFAGVACDLAGGRWYIEVTAEGPVIAGKLIDPSMIDPVAMCLLYAEPEDDPKDVFIDEGHRVIEADKRALRLLQLDTSAPFDLEDEDLGELNAMCDALYS